MWNRIWINLSRSTVITLFASHIAFHYSSVAFPPLVFLPAFFIFLTWDAHYGLLVHLPRKWTVSHSDLVAEVDTQCVRSGDSYFVLGLAIYYAGYRFQLGNTYWVLAAAFVALILFTRLFIFWFRTEPFIHHLKDQGSKSGNVEEAFNVMESLVSRRITRRIAFPITLFLTHVFPLNGNFVAALSVCAGAACIWAAAAQQNLVFAGLLLLINIVESIAGGLTRSRLADSYFSRWWMKFTYRLTEFLVLTSLGISAILDLGYQDGSFWLGATIVMAIFAWMEDSMYTVTGMILERPLKQPMRMWRFQWKSAKLSTQIDQDWMRFLLAAGIIFYGMGTSIFIAFVGWTVIAWGRGRKLSGKDESW